MDASRFDRLAMTVGHRATRRTTLGLLAALGLTGLVSDDAATSCQGGTGGRCGRATDLECCSGRCVRKPGTRKRFCRAAPGQGICTILQDKCQSAGSIGCGADADRCTCFRTIQGYSFCGSGTNCVDHCETNADCEKRDGGRRGDRCVVGLGCCPSNRSCTQKCPSTVSA